MSQLRLADGTPVENPDAVLAAIGVRTTTVALPDGTDDLVAAAVADPDRLADLVAVVDIPAEALAAAPVDMGAARGVLVIDPADDATAADREGFAAWHVNDVPEHHLVLSGDGSFFFVAPDEQVVELVLGAGDTVLIDRAEHRYVAREAQAFLVRHAGESMTPTRTDRSA